MSNRSTPRTRTARPSRRAAQRDASRAYDPTFGHPGQRNVEDPTYRVSRTSSTNTFLTLSASVESFAQQSFALSSVPGYTEFTACFDQYRINRVECWLENNSINQANNTIATVASVVDQDDSSALASLAAAYEYPQAIISLQTAGHYHDFVPHIAVAAYSGGFTGYANTTSWLDCGSPGIEHYGLKVAASLTGVASSCRLTTRYHLEFRHGR